MIARFLNKRRRGVLAVVALAGMVPVSGMMSANLNTSQMIDDRRQAQDAADTLARTHAAWTARALNIISMNNVTATQLMSVAVGSEALFMTTNELWLTGGMALTAIGIHAGEQCSPRTKHPLAIAIEVVIWSTPCGIWHGGIGIPATKAITRAENINDDFDPIHGIEVATKGLKAIDGMNRALAARHPRAMNEIAVGYHTLLEINDHHFADPCNSAAAQNCRTTNSRDGMALPIEEADVVDYGRFLQVMQTGMTVMDTTFNERGFRPGSGPLAQGGSRRRPHLKDYINHVTEIGTALYDMKRFYDSPLSDMPRHPFAGPGDAYGGYTPPGEAPDEETPFDDDTVDVLDTMLEIIENADKINQAVLKVLRNLPLAYDRHPEWSKLKGQQSRRGPNSFTRNFAIMQAMVLAPTDIRSRFPVGLSFGRGPIVFAAPVPEIYTLKDISVFQGLPPVETTTMPDAYRILAYTQKEMSRRMGQAVLTDAVDSHTGYAQAGVYNPDGATLFTQNWHGRLMPATRLDDVRAAANALDSEARQSFDDLVKDLEQVKDTGSWGRVHVH